jgi:protein arginine kinase activator
MVCGKKPAKIHVTQIKNGEKKSVHMCQECAQKQAMGSAISSGFLGDILKQESGAATPDQPTERDLETCEGCGQTYRAFKETGRLGCAECYQRFEDMLVPLIRKVQKGETHVGKRPQGVKEPTLAEKVEDLRVQLRQAVEHEEFEKAAQLRDQIRQMEQDLPEGSQ